LDFFQARKATLFLNRRNFHRYITDPNLFLLISELYASKLELLFFIAIAFELEAMAGVVRALGVGFSGGGELTE
jgi:hypothetical protein